jgi:hypothetical protein
MRSASTSPKTLKLMTNLQTVAESLATKCQGRAWIIVTAQEDMNSGSAT